MENVNPESMPSPEERKPITPANDRKAVDLIAQRVIKERIGGDLKHGWGVEDSLALIIALWVDEVVDEPSDAKRGWIKAVINPSAFRQMLEKKGALTPALTKSVNSILSGLDL